MSDIRLHNYNRRLLEIAEHHISNYIWNNLRLTHEERYNFIDFYLNDTKELVVNKFINHYYEKNFGCDNTNADEKFVIVCDHFYFPHDTFEIFRDITVKIFDEPHTLK